jgi:hypothetical protein
VGKSGEEKGGRRERFLFDQNYEFLIFVILNKIIYEEYRIKPKPDPKNVWKYKSSCMGEMLGVF